MDTKSILVGLAITLIIAIPFLIIYFNKSKLNKKNLKLVQDLASQNGYKITKSEKCGDFIIAIDQQNPAVFFFKQNQHSQISDFVDLKQIKTCNANKKTMKSGNDFIIEQLSLLFIPHSKSEKITELVLFDARINMQLTDELRLMEVWEKRINELLQS